MTAPKVQRRSAKSPAKPEPTSRDISAALVSAGRPKSCGGVFTALKAAFGDKVAANRAAEGCKRLPRHHGDHVEAKPRGLMTPGERKAASQRRASKVASRKAAPKGTNRFVTVNGTKYRVVVTATGEASVMPVTAKPKATVTTKVQPKAATKSRRLSKAAAGRLAQAVEDGSVKPSAALSRVAASQRGRRNRPVRVAR